MHHPILRFATWVCAILSVFYFVGFTARSFVRFYRRAPGWGWLEDIWSAMVVSTMPGAAAIAIWFVLAIDAAHP